MSAFSNFVATKLLSALFSSFLCSNGVKFALSPFCSLFSFLAFFSKAYFNVVLAPSYRCSTLLFNFYKALLTALLLALLHNLPASCRTHLACFCHWSAFSHFLLFNFFYIFSVWDYLYKMCRSSVVVFSSLMVYIGIC